MHRQAMHGVSGDPKLTSLLSWQFAGGTNFVFPQLLFRFPSLTFKAASPGFGDNTESLLSCHEQVHEQGMRENTTIFFKDRVLWSSSPVCQAVHTSQTCSAI